MTDERDLYRNRFDAVDRESKAELWRVLCQSYLQRFVSAEDAVVDLGAGDCAFINHIACGRKYAVDVNPDTASFAAPDVQVVLTAATAIPLDSASVDVVFASNFFEHMPSKADVLTVLKEVRRILRPQGSLLVLQPNIRAATRVYWDFFDHHTPLSDRSMVEALHLCGFEVVAVVPRFLPYSTKSRLPASPRLLRWYLRLPVVWPVFGRQMFIRARASTTS